MFLNVDLLRTLLVDGAVLNLHAALPSTARFIHDGPRRDKLAGVNDLLLRRVLV